MSARTREQSQWDVRALTEEGFGAVLLSGEVTYLREVFPAEQVSMSCQVVGLSADGARWRIQHAGIRENEDEAAVVRSLGAWTDVCARRVSAPPSGLRDTSVAARSDDCEVIGDRP
ncbi:thioesterase family protein [Streptomyces sp. NBC_00035]|uniref:thioesterase family protein n=1 Tax=unclassified Streptomyces TaxID=2593676 RepID=UPI00386F9366